jgi:hypothetical protein
MRRAVTQRTRWPQIAEFPRAEKQCTVASSCNRSNLPK